MTLNLMTLQSPLPSVGITGVRQRLWLSQCWGLNPAHCVCEASALPTELYSQQILGLERGVKRSPLQAGPLALSLASP